jgi:hypothetical protein
MADTAVSTTNLSTKFKYLYGPVSYAMFNTANPVSAKIEKKHGSFKGKSNGFVIDAVLGFTGSVGSAVLPETNVYLDVNATLQRKKSYARMLLDREAMLASKGSDAAFQDLTKYQTKKCLESFNRNFERQLFAIENEMIFQGDNATNVSGSGTAGSPYVVRGLSTNWVEGHVEVGDGVQYAGEATILKISNIARSTRDVSLVGTSAALAAATGASAVSGKFYLQGSTAAAATPTSGNGITSIYQVARATSGTLYGVTVGERFQSQQINASSAGIQTDIINQLVTQVEQYAGESPDLLVTSYKQYRKLQDSLGDKLRYMDVTNRDKLFNHTKFNFQGIQWNTASGEIPIVVSRMCPDDSMLALNTSAITLHTAQAPKWFDEDGTVLIRMPFTTGSSNSDAYEARYGFYGELFVHPAGQGVVYGLA